jgi:hypothetical protein
MVIRNVIRNCIQGVSHSVENKGISSSTYWTTPFIEGNPDGDGKSLATAWNGFAKIDWTKIKPGSTLYVCGTHNETLTVGASGSATRYINIKGNFPDNAGIIDGQDTRTLCIDVNEKSYVHIEAITLTQATESCLHIDGASIITTKDVVVSESGNQGVQHLNTCQATHTNITASNNTDDGISLHDTARVTIIGGTITGNAQGINNIAGSQVTASNITFTGNTQYDVYVTAATTPGSAIATISDSTFTQLCLADTNGKLILNNCTTAAVTVESTDGTAYLVATNTVFGGAGSFGRNANITMTGCLVNTYTSSEATTVMTLSKCYVKDIDTHGGTINAEHCLFDGTGKTDHIIDIISGGTGNIKYCVFKGIPSAKFGIAVRTGATATITGCTFYDGSKVGKGIFTQVNTTINNCMFVSLANGITQTAGTVSAVNCAFYDNTANTAGTVGLTASQTGDTKLVAPASNDFSLGAGSSGIGNGKDMGAELSTGISSAVWGNGTTQTPAVTTKSQAAAWDIGAYIH